MWPFKKREEPQKEEFDHGHWWPGTHKFSRSTRGTNSNRYVVPSWYKCKHCGIEFQTSPPTYHALGDMDSLYDTCPDCESK